MLTRKQVLVTLAAGAVGVAAFVTVMVVLAPQLLTAGSGDGDGRPPYAAPAPLPPLSTAPTLPGTAGMPDADWVATTSAATGIPERALAAYAGAALQEAQLSPECGIGWNTLAAIGKVESDHGRHDGSSVAANGTVTPAIYGVPIGDDTDKGAVDGTAKNDRAAGPMQFTPESWASWATDANGDGTLDIQNLDDSAMSAANYLCRASGELVTQPGWRAAIAAYNSAPSYAVAVASAANKYAKAAADD
ncbi:MAG: lytic transglycosylase domain-containing protein [Rhodoglobus sp.]